MAPEGDAMAYPLGAVERAMKVRDVILHALAGKLTWIQAAEILGRSARSIRRMRLQFERYGCDALYDRRRGRP
jgi:transposase